MFYKLNIKNNILSGTINLPTSKSISNRLLIMHALSEKKFSIRNISSSKDTQLLQNALSGNSTEINIGHAGTAMRFLTAYYALGKNEIILTGSERMKNRPIAELVNALKQIGADITFIEKDGYPPLRIKPTSLTGGTVTIDGSISSQYITAILLIAPKVPGGITIKINNKLVSEAYVRLSLALMHYMGIDYNWKGNEINIAEQEYDGRDIGVEADWSGASYWYSIAALTREADINIRGLEKESLQGDSIIAEMYRSLGVDTTFGDNQVTLSKAGMPISSFVYDFSNCPDLIQTAVVTCGMLGVPFTISGAETLRIKETDRIAALQNEMKKFGVTVQEPRLGVLSWEGKEKPVYSGEAIDTYDDHRMALAFAPAALKFDGIRINEPSVVVKSYPEFWDHLTQIGFEISES